MKLPKLNIIQATTRHTGTLFIFHGSGDTGNNIKEWINILNREEFKFPHIKIIYPTAPAQKYTPNGGMMSNVWFNRKDLSINTSEEESSINSMCNTVSELIETEHVNGIPYNKMILAGFSMGGALALHLAYRFKTSLAGCVTMSSFLNKNSLIYEYLKQHDTKNMPPLLQFHGRSDSLIPIQWGEETNKILKEFGLNIKFIPLDNTAHELNRVEIQEFKRWILNVIPVE